MGSKWSKLTRKLATSGQLFIWIKPINLENIEHGAKLNNHRHNVVTTHTKLVALSEIIAEQDVIKYIHTIEILCQHVLNWNLFTGKTIQIKMIYKL